jgi:hypothetical protein
MVDFDSDLTDVHVSREQAGEGRARDRGRFGENKVVGGLDLDFSRESSGGRTTGGGHSSVRIAGAEEKRTCLCRHTAAELLHIDAMDAPRPKRLRSGSSGAKKTRRFSWFARQQSS